MKPTVLAEVTPAHRCDKSSPGGRIWSRATSYESQASGHGSEHIDSLRGPVQSVCEMHSVCENIAAGTGLEPLTAAFDAGDVQTWEPMRFKMVGKIQDSARNHGQVVHMIDKLTGNEVAVKQIPNSWICQQPEEFDRQHSGEKEQPWVSIGCTALLTHAAYQYVCPLLGVYRDEETTHIVMEFARDGDLFSWCSSSYVSPPGPEREALVQPLARQIIDSVRQLHEISIVHGDISLENILLSGPLQIQLIDFGQSSSNRSISSSVHCKPSYQAPEMHTQDGIDGFLSDAFAVGVTLYALLCNDYPWLSTKPGCNKAFDYFSKNGFRAFIKRRRHDHFLSEPVVELLSGLLDPDPSQRLTLGESAWAEGGRRSVGQSSWLSARTIEA
mmetsp:Transcript_87605/g.228589  ORF Transcript_87605/g.228589 Transcript_87605/m.228589 type:complete len:385 (-) Transcript_87605:58-1212(-)